MRRTNRKSTNQTPAKNGYSEVDLELLTNAEQDAIRALNNIISTPSKRSSVDDEEFSDIFNRLPAFIQEISLQLDAAIQNNKLVKFDAFIRDGRFYYLVGPDDRH